jgi:DNA-3-methyladenine glycosylase II
MNHANFYSEAQQFLMSVDADWQALITHIGPCEFTPKTEREPFEALVRAVAYQQLSTKAGDAILRKFLQLFDRFPTPQQLLNTKFEQLRAVGFSGRKIETVQGISHAAISGMVPSREIADGMRDEDLIAQLVTIKGIGQWSVEMMLMFTLQRMDILPADDLGIAEGYRRLKKLDTAPKKKQLTEMGKAWSPYRTVASWYLWQVPK